MNKTLGCTGAVSVSQGGSAGQVVFSVAITLLSDAHLKLNAVSAALTFLCMSDDDGVCASGKPSNQERTYTIRGEKDYRRFKVPRPWNFIRN
eukprot:3945339-Amphidinium_carterae.1